MERGEKAARDDAFRVRVTCFLLVFSVVSTRTAGVVSFLVSAITAILKKDKKLCICIFYAVFSCTNDQN